MNKETIKAFIAWLEAASEDEISQRIEEIRSLEKSAQLSAEGRADLRQVRRLIDEELIARLDLSQTQGSASRGGKAD